MLCANVRPAGEYSSSDAGDQGRPRRVADLGSPVTMFAEGAVTVPSDAFTRIPVGGPAPYDVIVGDGAASEIPRLETCHRIALLSSDSLRRHAGPIAGMLRDAGREVHEIELPDREAAKTPEVAAQCWARLGELGFTRSDAVVAVGGGAVTDLAGFVAATYARGIPVVHVPTSLTGMVDAAIGGKTGLNTAAGKNLVGAFHHPLAVVCDLAMLDSLPEIELLSGFAEIVRAGFIADPGILDVVQADVGSVTTPGTPQLREVMERSIRVKAHIVSEDPLDQGRRAFLNYGHTLGHAIEKVEGYRWRHGSAVSVGLCYAGELGRVTGRLDDATADRHFEILTDLGLPTVYRPDAWPALLAAMQVDKKARGSRLRFVVLEQLGRPVLIEDPDAKLLDAAYAPCCRPRS